MINMKYLTYTFFIIIGTVLIDKLCLWMEENGWLYYRRYGMPGGSFLRALLIAFATLFQPRVRNSVELNHCQMQKFKRTATEVSDKEDEE